MNPELHMFSDVVSSVLYIHNGPNSTKRTIPPRHESPLNSTFLLAGEAQQQHVGNVDATTWNVLGQWRLKSLVG